MKETMTDLSKTPASEPTADTERDESRLHLDWRTVADERLDHLVEIEHDYSVMHDRLAMLQNDYRESLAQENRRLRHVHELERDIDHMDDRLHDLARECRREYEAMQATFLQSRSWRITRPLRAMSAQLAVLKHQLRRALRFLLRIAVVRRLARLIVRPLPGLHRRVRRMLYHTDQGD